MRDLKQTLFLFGAIDDDDDDDGEGLKGGGVQSIALAFTQVRGRNDVSYAPI